MPLTKVEDFMIARLEQRRTDLVAQIADMESRPLILDELNAELTEVASKLQDLGSSTPRTKVEDFLVLQLGQRRSAITSQIEGIESQPIALGELNEELAEIDAKIESLNEEGSPPPLPASVKAVFEGDSITSGGYPTTAMTYAPAGPSYTTAIVSTSGFSAAQMNTAYTTRVGAAYDATKAANVLCLLAGTNDNAPAFPVETYRNLRSMMRKARATGYQRRLIGTLTSRDDTGKSFDGSTLPLNLAIRALYNSDLEANALFDFAANALFDTALDAHSSTYYNVDRLHPRAAGQAVLGGILGPILAAQIQSASVLIQAPTTWSPYDLTGTHLSLSNSDKTVTRATSDVLAAQAKAFNGASTGKVYWEYVLDNAAGISLGLCNRTYEPFLHAGSKTLLNNVDAIGCLAGDTQYNSSGSLGSIGAFQTGDVISTCLDMGAKRWWVKRNNGDWNGDASANPETGTGGVDVVGLGAGPIYPAVCIPQQGGQITARFAATQVDGPVPVGFAALE